MRQLLLLSGLMIMNLMNVSGQFYYKPKPISAFNENSCNNTIVCEAFNMPQNGYLQLSNANQNQIQTVSNLDTINNFCAFEQGSLSLYTIDYYSSNGYLNNYQLFSSAIPNHLNYTVSNYISPTTGSSFDGSLTLVFDSTFVLSNYTITIDQQGTFPVDTFLNSTSIQLDSLKIGYLQIGITNPLNAADYAFFRIFVGNPDTDLTYVNSGLDVGVSFQHANNLCEGWIILNVPNATGTVLNNWNDGPYNDLMRTGLCPGLYSSYTYDFVGGSYASASIDTVVIVNDNTSYIDSSIYTNVSQDTTYSNFSNCQFDYLAAIDSVTYSEDTLFNSGGVVIVIYEMTMYQDNNFVTVSDSLVMVNDSLITLDVVIYCDLFKSTFKGRRIVYMRGAVEHNFYSNNLSVAEESEAKFVIYPNPANDNLKVQFESETTAELCVYNSNGNKIEVEYSLIGNEYLMDISYLAEGMYVIEIKTSIGTTHKKFIKE